MTSFNAMLEQLNKRPESRARGFTSRRWGTFCRRSATRSSAHPCASCCQFFRLDRNHSRIHERHAEIYFCLAAALVLLIVRRTAS